MNERKLIYGLYPRSFVEANGKSAFRNIAEASRLFLPLGPDYVWMNPIFPSGGCDGGYDIISPFQIDTVFGSETEFLSLANGELKGKVLMDVVFNHISTRSALFQKDLTHRAGPYNCIWAERATNWDSLFGGSAWELEPRTQRYYLHLFNRAQADLDLTNPEVIEYLRRAVKFWADKGVAGYRIDTCNILSKNSLAESHADGGMPRGFEHYHQVGSTEILSDILSVVPECFTVGETVAASIADMAELTSGPLTCCFNAGVNDAADGMFLTPALRREKPNYKAWLEALVVNALHAPEFCIQLESHDFPRSTSRFGADPRALAMLQFLLPFNYVCLYMGQEIGMENRRDLLEQGSVDAYAKADPHAQGLYEQLTKSGKTEAEALSHLNSVSRLHCRLNSAEVFGDEYWRQMQTEGSVWRLYHQLIRLWRSDPVLLNGRLEVREITEDGVMEFVRELDGQQWQVHLNLTQPGRSYARNGDAIIR